MEESPDAEPTFRFQFQLTYDPEVENALYNIENLKDLPLDVEHHTLQRKSPDTICCLSCGMNFKHPIQRDAIEEHFKHHEVTTKQSITFDAYHKAFLRQPRHNQMQQVFYVPLDVFHAKCLLCDKVIQYNLLMAHSKGAGHSKRVQKGGHEWNYVHIHAENGPNEENELVEDLNALNLENKPEVSNKKSEKSEKATEKKGKKERKERKTEKFNRSDIIIANIDRVDVKDDTNKELHDCNVIAKGKRKSKRKNVVETVERSDCLSETKSAMISQNKSEANVLREKNIEKNEKVEDGKVQGGMNENENEDRDLCYDEETLMKLYPTCNTPRGQRRPEILTVQKRAEFEKFCLACLCSIYVRGVEHISGEKHARAVSKYRDALRHYHAFWMAQPPAAQLQQVHFNPHSEKTMTCTKCRQRTIFARFGQHDACIRTTLERNASCVFPPELCKFELNYDKEIVRKFFYGVQYDLSRDVLGTHVPLAYVHKKYFHCLLCYNSKVGRMVRNVEQWKEHLFRYHCNAGPARDANLRRVIEFHEYWAAQTLERQYYLCHFTLKIKHAGIGCDQGHFLPLEQAVEHVETENCALQRLVEEEREHRVNMQRPQEENAAAEQNGQEKPPRPQHRIESLYPSETNASIVLPIHLKHHDKHFQQVKDDPESVKCTACKLDMRNSATNLRHHVASPKHAQKFPKVGGRVNYFCDICNKYRFSKELDWMNHLDSSEHECILKNMPATRRDDMKEYFCRSCKLVIYGDKITLIRHEASGSRRAKKQPNVMTDQMKELLKSRAVINQGARDLVAKCEQFRRESEPKVQQCIGDLENLIKQSYPSCKIYQFGSRVAGFVVKDSDLDLFVDVGGKYLGQDLDYHQERKVVLEVRRLLKADPKTYVDLHTVLSARVPIAKVVHAPTELDCDLSFVNGLSVENTRLIRFYADLQPRFGEAVLVLKEWGVRMAHKLRNDMTSYALCMMLIFSMQRDGHLPSVDELRRRTTFDVPNINGWDTVDYATLDRERLLADLRRPESVADVVRGFFEYYAAGLQYAREVVCPMLGKTFDVRTFDAKGKETPREMHTYRTKVEADPDAQFKVGSHMFVQDPFDLGHNLTKMANKDFVRNFKNLCKLSAEHIKE